jgi:hypothetical protein
MRLPGALGFSFGDFGALFAALLALNHGSKQAQPFLGTALSLCP